LAIAALVATSLTSTSAIGSKTTTTHPSDEASKLVKSMEDMSIQTNEINRLKEQIKSLRMKRNWLKSCIRMKLKIQED